MWKIITMLAVLMAPAVAYAEPPPPDEVPCVEGDKRPRCLFEFDEDGEVHTESGVAERTFDFPPLKVGFIFDATSVNVYPYAAIQVKEWTMFGGEIFSTNLGLSWNRALIDLHWAAIPIMYIGPSIWAGWDFSGDGSWAAGVGVSILKF